MRQTYGKFRAVAPSIAASAYPDPHTRPVDLNEYAAQSRNDNDKWWHKLVCAFCETDIKPDGRCANEKCLKYDWYGSADVYKAWVPITDRNKGELIALMHSELSECLEGVRKNLRDDKLPHRSMEEVELADLLIRVFDYAGAFGLDLEGAYHEKRAYNAQRADHSYAARAAAGGKQF